MNLFKKSMALATLLLSVSTGAGANQSETCLQVSSGYPLEWSIYNERGDIVSYREIQHVGLTCMQLPNTPGMSYRVASLGAKDHGAACDHRAVQLGTTVQIQETQQGTLSCESALTETAGNIDSYTIALRLSRPDGASNCLSAKTPAPKGLSVEVFSKDSSTLEPLEWSRTDEQGQVFFRLDPTALQDSGARAPNLDELVFRVYENNRLVMTTDSLSTRHPFEYSQPGQPSNSYCLGKPSEQHAEYLVAVDQVKTEKLKPLRKDGLLGSGIAVNEIQTGVTGGGHYSAWITIYNIIGRISDSGCNPSDQGRRWSGYFGGPFRVRYQVIRGNNCQGQEVYDGSGTAVVPLNRCTSTEPLFVGGMRVIVDDHCG
jgi:hypothetical protein